MCRGEITAKFEQ